MTSHDPKPDLPVRRARLLVPATLLIAAMLGVVAIGAWPKLKRRDALTKATLAASGSRRVLIGKVTQAPTTFEVTLPGSVAPLQSAVLYAKTTGFVRRYMVDIGDTVKMGDLLAVVDAPETRQELTVARARLREAEVNLGITQAIADRTETLSKSGIASAQASEELQARANSAVASLGTTRAEVGRVGALVGYQNVTAPFDGVIIRRNVEVGSLVSPSVGQAGTVLFEVARLDALKVIVDVPQGFAPLVRTGTVVTVFAPSNPRASVAGTVSRTAGALDVVTRTLKAEVRVAAGGPMLAGSFVNVRLSLQRPSPPLVIPASALIARKEGTRIAVLGDGNTVTLVKITIGRDLGKELELTEGGALGQQVVLNPADDLADGSVVAPAPPATP